jgi:hypothetical protein
MHRTEGLYNDSNLFKDGPPGTRVEANFLNAVQEEIAYLIEQAGLTLKTASTETRTQLKEATDNLYVAAPMNYDSDSDSGTIVAATNTTIMDTDLGTVTSGDWLLVEYQCPVTKGGTGGQTVFDIYASGTGVATIRILGGQSVATISKEMGAGELWKLRMSSIIRVNQGGSFYLGFRGRSAGSDSTTGSSYMQATWFRQQ